MCSEFIDIAVLMDASGSVGEENFEREKQFVSSLARSLSIEEGDAHLAVVSYSNSAQVHIQLTNSTDQDQFNEELRQIPYTGFTTNIRFALHVVDTQVFGEGRSSRPYVTRIVILLTDGRQTRHPEDVFQTDPVQNLRDKEVKRVAVGVG
ncbi:matrilin-2-like [Actinia tenebrosa]|uniref:Matrilin-2-like n=1 Tax=Actinia tenebrosa TaxID=6105 RepID=A0A6P8H701_ACTTE|nr:matrilin-2-like [Actinia tenebrosa]